MLCKHLSPIVFEDISAVAASGIDWKKFGGKTVLISGANGFLASYLVYFFLFINETHDAKCKVIGISRNWDKAVRRFGQLLDRSDFKIVTGDVSLPLEIGSKIDFVIHAASQASPKYYGVDPVGTLNANVLGTHQMLQIAKNSNAESFLFFSTSEVYGSVPPEMIPTKEHEYGYIDINNVRACYAESKRLGETMCVSWLHQFGTSVKIVRPFHTYGPGMDLDDGRVYADFISDIVNNRNIVMKSDGAAQRAFCYLKDATEGFLRVLLDGNDGEAYNVGNPTQEISILDLAEKLTTLYPKRGLKVQKQVQSGSGYIISTVNRNSPDISKMRKLGWLPKISIEEGFKRTIESYL